jgi:hypothetical protein
MCLLTVTSRTPFPRQCLPYVLYVYAVNYSLPQGTNHLPNFAELRTPTIISTKLSKSNSIQRTAQQTYAALE